jgi:hypothetical protein
LLRFANVSVVAANRIGRAYFCAQAECGNFTMNRLTDC